MKISKNTIFSLILILLIMYPLSEVILKIANGREHLSVGQLTSAVAVGEILEGNSIQQSFQSNANNITSIEVLTGNYNRTNNSVLEFGIREENSDENLRTSTISTELLRDNEYYSFEFEPIKDTKDKIYNFYIKSIDGTKENSVTFYKSDESLLEAGTLYINGEEQTGDLTFKVNSKDAYPRMYILLIVALAITLFALFFIITRYVIKLHKAFLIFSVIYGMFFLFIFPFSQSPDEPVHLFRAYEISTGSLVSMNNEGNVGNYIPKSLEEVLHKVGHNSVAFHPENKINYGDYKGAFSIDLNPENTEFYYFGGAAVYVPIQYIPQSLGLLIGRLLGFSALGMIFLGKLFNLIAWVLLVYYSIKLIPIGKTLIMTISLFPIVLQQVTSLSPDAMLMGVSALFISLCIRFYKKPELFDKRYKVLLYMLGTVITLIKVVYLPICLLLFILPKERFVTNRRKNIYVIGAIGTAIVASGAWLLYANSKFTVGVAPFPGVNAGEQIKFALSNVFYYSKIVRYTFVNNFLFYLETMIGVMGWLDFKLPHTIILGYIFVVVILSFLTETVEEGRWKILMIVSFILSALLIFSSLYAGWTPVGQGSIDGVQGRYFIPVIALLPLAAPSIKVEINTINTHRYLYSFINWATAYALIVIFIRYFIY